MLSLQTACGITFGGSPKAHMYKLLRALTHEVASTLGERSAMVRRWVSQSGRGFSLCCPLCLSQYLCCAVSEVAAVRVSGSMPVDVMCAEGVRDNINHDVTRFVSWAQKHERLSGTESFETGNTIRRYHVGALRARCVKARRPARERVRDSAVIDPFP